VPAIEITRHDFSNERHTTSYLSAGPENGPLAVCVHGWPELSISWRNQLPFLAGLGFRVVAPDMRGYGESSVYEAHDAYRLEEVTQDMLDLVGHLGADKALWIGHDWGSPVVWSMASQYPEACVGVVSLCVPYATLERGLQTIIDLVDRSVYPADEYPAGQWEYMKFYEEDFASACAPMDANPRTFCQAIFRKGDPAGKGQPSATSTVRKTGGWLGGSPEAPELPRDDDVVTEAELAQYVASLEKNGFAAANAWYMNHPANEQFAKHAKANELPMPVLFLHARHDFTCETMDSDLAKPMRELCADLTEEVVDSGHWMAQEQPFAVNQAMAKWLVKTNLLG
jgi:pimeloyl-ACP methyl ester carboxylesterase